MSESNLKSFLELKVISKDEHLMELNVRATDTNFSGSTQVYDQFERLSEFASTLTDFPTENQELLHESFGSGGQGPACFSIRYYCIDATGHIGAEVTIETTEWQSGRKNRVELHIIVEPTAIDNFRKELFSLVKNEEGTAVLYGRDNRLPIQ